MYYINGIRLDGRELLEISQQKCIPKLKDFALKMHPIFGNTYAYVKKHVFLRCSKINRKTKIEWHPKHWTIVPTCYATTDTGIDKER